MMGNVVQGLVQGFATFDAKRDIFTPFLLNKMWSHKIFDAQIKITRHITKVLYSDVTGQRSSNRFRSVGT